MSHPTVVVPLLAESNRVPVAIVIRWLLCIPRAAAWLLGACISTIVYGFVTGWKDAA